MSPSSVNGPAAKLTPSAPSFIMYARCCSMIAFEASALAVYADPRFSSTS